MFYLLSLLFIFKNIFYIINKEKLDKRFYQKDIQMSPFLFYYYLISVIYIFWLVLGLLTGYKTIFYILLIVELLKFPIYHISVRLYDRYLKISPIIHILFLFILLYAKFL